MGNEFTVKFLRRYTYELQILYANTVLEVLVKVQRTVLTGVRERLFFQMQSV